MGTRRDVAYHHGDLRRALIGAARDILAETGRWDFSLREVARRAGVSHNAPYRHFADKDALLAAVGTEGHGELQRRTAVQDKAPDAATALAMTGSAYVEYGIAHPALYRLMFAQTLPRTGDLPDALARVAGVARGALRDAIEAGAHDGSLAIDPADERAVIVAAVAAWSLVHGVTMLTIDRVVERETGPQDGRDVAEQAVRQFVTGLRWRHRGPHGAMDRRAAE